MREHRPLQRGHAAHVLGALQAQDVGMAADRPRRRAGRVEHDHVEGPPRRPGRRIGLHHLGGELQPRQVLAQAVEARGRHVDGRDLGAGRGQAGGLPARRRAQVGNRLPATSPAMRVTSAAAASCTHHAPSA